METIKAVFICFMCTVIHCSNAGETYFYDRERGWFWFEEPEKKEDKETAKAQENSTLPLEPTFSPREILKKQGEEWEKALATAMLHPSQENYINYLAQTKAIQEQAGNFAFGMQKTIWANPEYDRTIKNPINPEALVVKNQQKEKEVTETFKQLSRDNALVFFFSSTCAYCHKFAPILKRFAQHYGLDILPISIDGKGMPAFPSPKQNQAMARKLQVKSVPAVYLANPHRNKIVAVSYGYTDWTTLIEKLKVAAEAMEKK